MLIATSLFRGVTGSRYTNHGMVPQRQRQKHFSAVTREVQRGANEYRRCAIVVMMKSYKTGAGMASGDLGDVPNPVATLSMEARLTAPGTHVG